MTVEDTEAAYAKGEAAAPPAEWYVGRAGQQFGPFLDADFQRMLQSGQIAATDLVWRDGFPEWVPAQQVLPTRPQSSPAPTPPSQPQAPSPVQRPAPAPAPATATATAQSAPAPSQASRSPDNGPAVNAQPHSQPAPAPAKSPPPPKATRREKKRARQEGGSRSMVRKIGRAIAWTAILLFFTLTLGAAYFVVSGDKTMTRIATAWIPKLGGDRIASTAPIGGFGPTIEATDASLQKSALFQTLKKHHPAWYSERVKETTEATRAGRPEAEIVGALLQHIVKLRRQFAGDAASAPPARLKSIASLFSANLTRLKTQNVDACFQFVSAGESAPLLVPLFQSPEHTSALQAQLVTTFEAIDEGRRTPRVYPQPKTSDYDLLIAALEKRGWKKDDLALFADGQKLSQAPPATVCRLVSEWFEAQLALTEADVQIRLLADSVRPVVAG